MSILSSLTGVHISPHGVHIEPLKALGTLATVGTLGAAGPLAGAIGAIPGLSSVANVAGKIPGIQGLASFLGGNGGMNALGAAEGVNAGMLQSKQNDLAKQALGTATQSYGERAPLRTAGVQGMLNPGAGIAPKIAALSQGSSNPFQRGV